jgi:hypothetical protein
LSSGFTRHHDFKLFAFAKLRQGVATFGPAYDEKCGPEMSRAQSIDGQVALSLVSIVAFGVMFDNIRVDYL